MFYSINKLNMYEENTLEEDFDPVGTDDDTTSDPTEDGSLPKEGEEEIPEESFGDSGDE